MESITEGYPADYSSSFDYSELEEHAPCIKSKVGALFLPALYSVLFVTGLLGNSLVIFLLVRAVKLKSTSDVAFLNLAISDLLFVVTFPFLAHYARDQWVFGDVLCKIIMGLYHVGFYGGIYFVALMSVDNCLAVTSSGYATKTTTAKTSLAISLTVWVISFGSSFPEVTYNQVINDGEITCRPLYPQTAITALTILHIFKMNILGFLIPLTVLTVCHAVAIRRSPVSQAIKNQAVKRVSCIVLAFLVFWTPYNIASFLDALHHFHIFDDCESSKMLDLSLQITEAIAFMYSCFYPLVFIGIEEKLKRYLIKKFTRNLSTHGHAVKTQLSLTVISNTASVAL
ncbi:C-C chemokine receptor type 8-like [Polypterus senegalus]